MLVGNRYRDLRSLHRSIIWKMAHSRVGDGVVDILKQTITVASLNNLVFANSCDFEDFDFGNIGMGLNRWKIFLRQYIDSEQYWSWVLQSQQIKKNGSELVFITKPIDRKVDIKYNGDSSKLYGGGQQHRWGNCLLGATFRFKPKPTIMLLSRTSALTKGGCLDLAFASIAARDLAESLSIDRDQIQFAWAASSFQVSSWQLVPLATAWGWIDEICALEDETPTGKSFARYAIGRGRQYKYASSMRAIRKADEIAAGVMPSTFVRDLRVPE